MNGNVSAKIQKCYLHMRQGEKKGIQKVALGMIQEGMDSKTINKLTGLTQEEIDKLASAIDIL